MIASDEKSPVPRELADWAREVKAEKLRVESAMIAVVSLAYKLSHPDLRVKLSPNDKQGIRRRVAKKRKLRQNMNHALRALEGALRQEYSVVCATEVSCWTQAKLPEAHVPRKDSPLGSKPR